MEGDGFGEMSLLEGKARRTKTVTCACASGCEVVSIRGSDFLKLVKKSTVVRESFEKLNRKRHVHNESLQAVHEDPELRKYANH